MKVAGGEWSELRPDKGDEKAFLYNEDKEMVKDHFVCHVGQTHTYSPGKAIGVYFGTYGHSLKVVEYRDGMWCVADTLKDLTPKKCRAT